MFEFPARPVDKREVIDAPEVPRELVEANYSLMEEVNRYYGGQRLIISFLESEMREERFPPDRPLRILDLGSGTCDIPAAVVNWAQTKELPLQYTCLEQQAAPLELARERDRLTELRVIESDLLAHTPQKKYDYVTISLVLHHFSFAKIKEILRKYADCAREAIVLNDLRRHRGLYWLTWLRTLFSARESRHDALLSVKKGFRPAEFEKFAGAVPNCSVEVQRKPLFRLRGILRFEGHDG